MKCKIMKKGFLLMVLCCSALVASAQTVLDEVICEGDRYDWDGDFYDTSDDYTKTYIAVDGTDSIVTLHLTVLPIAYTTIDTTIIEGESYLWNGDVYTTSGTYVDTLQKADGCDSIVTLNLVVTDNDVVINELQMHDMCSDDGVLEMLIDFDGFVDSIGLYFLKDTLDTIDRGIHDTIIAMPLDGHLSISYDNVRAGVYKANMVGYFCRNIVFEQEVSLTFLYPQTVFERRWDDVICVLTSAYNGGYDFIAFQWYKDGQPLQGETGYYLNRPLEEGAEYSAMLTEQDGTQLTTCPIVVELEEPEVSVEPTLVTKRQPVRCYVSEDADVYVYDALGRMIMNTQILHGETYLTIPAVQGVYLMKVVLQDRKERNVKIIIN